MTDSGATAPTSAETLAASVARLAQDLMEFSSERVGDMLGALLSVQDTPKQVKELVERADAAVISLAQATGGALL